MKRVRISTTVDAHMLETCRLLVGGADSQVVDRALGALITELEGERDLAALAAHPYDDDPDLSWEVSAGAGLPYDGEIPAAVRQLAARRRR